MCNARCRQLLASYSECAYLLPAVRNAKTDAMSTPTICQAVSWLTMFICCRLVISWRLSCFFLSHFHFPGSGQTVVTGLVPPPSTYVPSFLSRRGFSIPNARRFSSDLVTHAPWSQFFHKKEFLRVVRTRVHSGGIELVKSALLRTGLTPSTIGNADC